METILDWPRCIGLAGIILGTSYGCGNEKTSTETSTERALSNFFSLAPIGTYASGAFNQGGAEIVAHDPESQRLYVVNAASSSVDVIDISNPGGPALAFAISVTSYGFQANSVAKSPVEDAIAAAVENTDKQQPGVVVFFDTDGEFLSSVQVGALPDMLTFTPDGRNVLVANEGEPNDSYTVDPEGSVSVIDVSGGIAGVTQSNVRTADFRAFNRATLDSSIRIFGPGATVAQDLEPEFIAAEDGVAWVTLQENNAIAQIDIAQAQVTRLIGLGFKDHNSSKRKLDASDQDDGIQMKPWPIKGMYLPDGIASFRFFGATYLAMANEGDTRAYTGFNEEARIGSLVLDPTAFPNAAELQLATNLGRLKVTKARGDTDGDGDFDELLSCGGRSFSIRSTSGALLFDSGDDFEARTATAIPGGFNSDNTGNQTFDTRSDDKGPEPEDIEVGKIHALGFDHTIVFVGLERIGGIMVYDVTLPILPVFLTYVNFRDFSQTDPTLAGDFGPEGLLFISGEDSPTGIPLLVSSSEISGTTTIFEVRVDE